MPLPHAPRTLALAVCLLALGGVLPAVSAQETGVSLSFEHVVIDADNPDDPRCKTLADFSGDGLLDAVAASGTGDGMYWYEYPTWTKYPIRLTGAWKTDMQAGDVDGDGDADIIIPLTGSGGLRWYENPLPLGDPRLDTWFEPTISSGTNHHPDVEV